MEMGEKKKKASLHSNLPSYIFTSTTAITSTEVITCTRTSTFTVGILDLTMQVISTNVTELCQCKVISTNVSELLSPCDPKVICFTKENTLETVHFKV